MSPLSSSSSSFRLFPRLPVTSILPSSLRSVTCLRRQFLRNMWPIQLTFHIFIVRRIFLSFFTLCNISSFFVRSVQLIFSIPPQQHIQHCPFISDLSIIKNLILITNPGFTWKSKSQAKLTGHFLPVIPSFADRGLSCRLHVEAPRGESGNV